MSDKVSNLSILPILKELRTKVLPKEIAKYGKAFAKEISELLEMQNNVVKEVLAH